MQLLSGSQLCKHDFQRRCGSWFKFWVTQDRVPCCFNQACEGSWAREGTLRNKKDPGLAWWLNRLILLACQHPHMCANSCPSYSTSWSNSLPMAWEAVENCPSAWAHITHIRDMWERRRFWPLAQPWPLWPCAEHTRRWKFFLFSPSLSLTHQFK